MSVVVAGQNCGGGDLESLVAYSRGHWPAATLATSPPLPLGPGTTGNPLKLAEVRSERAQTVSALGKSA